MSIAELVDAFNGKYAGEKRRKDLEKRIEEIREKYEKPPQPLVSKKKSKEKKATRRKKRGYKR